MGYDNASENSRRVVSGMLSLVAGQAITFAEKNSDLIVIFDGPFNKFSGGRVLLFQQFVEDHTGCFPEIIKKVPACIKVFFRIGRDDSVSDRIILDTLESDDCAALFANLNITYVQFRGKIIPMRPLQNPSKLLSPPEP